MTDPQQRAAHGLRWLAIRLLSATLLLGALAACGGGGGETTSADAPTLQQQPSSVEVVAGTAATFQVVAGGTAPLAYQWLRDGSPIAQATEPRYTMGPATEADHGARFSVRVSNPAGVVDSSAATLTVKARVEAPAASAPTVVRAPADAAVAPGASATFTVEAGGTAPLRYQWQRDGTALPGATEASYTLTAVSAADHGARFSVRIDNAAGGVDSAAATLTVVAAPAAPAASLIATPPQAASVRSGRSATFTVEASRSSATFQWYRDGVAIAGATQATFRTEALRFPDHGARFSVRVSDGGVDELSAAALLSVTPWVVEVATTDASTHARLDDGTVLGWGSSRNLAVGERKVAKGSVVVAEDASGRPFTGVAAMSAGGEHVLVLRDDGTVWGWGSNSVGALGDGTLVDRTHPVQVVFADGAPLKEVVAVFGLRNHSMALRADGTVWAWGANTFGQLGDGTVRNSAVPVQVKVDATRALAGIVKVTGNGSGNLALARDGSVWAWGYGPLGNGTDSDTTSSYAVRVESAPATPLRSVTDIAAGAGHRLALLASGEVVTWGRGAYGTGLDDRDTYYSRPTWVTREDGTRFGNVAAVAAGFNYSILLDKGGTLWSVGDGSLGQLGIGVQGLGSSADRYHPTPVLDAQGRPFDRVTRFGTYQFHVVALRDDGSVWCWGYNLYGQVAPMPGSAVTLPTLVAAFPP